MRVIFLDFDGVLNSAASFIWEKRKKTIDIANTLSPICCSNLQYILERNPDVKIVISSTWRAVHTMPQINNILNSYGVEAVRVMDKTPRTMSGGRGHEIRLWLNDHANVTEYIILDDDPDAGNALNMEEGTDPKGHFFQTTWEDGLTIKTAAQVSALLRGEKVVKI